MCNHYRLDARDIRVFKDWEDVAGPPIQPELATDIWPKRQGLIMRMDDRKKTLDAMSWGVPMTLPGKHPGTTITKHVTNVRNLASPFWRSMLANPAQRCLVPFSSFAEPKPGRDAETGRPAEYWFTVNGAPIAAFAGIWRPSEAGNVYAFLTCEPNPLVAPLHPKAMPVILAPDDYEKWLTADYNSICALAAPFPSQLMSVTG